MGWPAHGGVKHRFDGAPFHDSILASKEWSVRGFQARPDTSIRQYALVGFYAIVAR